MGDLDSSIIWHDDEDPDYNKLQPKLVFSLFSFESLIEGCLESLRSYLDPFVKHYPWYIKAPDFSINKHKNFVYIYGELSYGDNINDEWLLTYLLWQFSIIEPSIYIHLKDLLDNEFLLVEATSILDTWMQPDICINRPWISKGRVIFVCESDHNPLNLETVLSHLSQFHYTVNEKLTEYFTGYFERTTKNYFLEYIYDFTVELRKRDLDALNSKPSLISSSINARTDNNISSTIESMPEKITTKLGVPLLALTTVKAKEISLREIGINVSFESLLSRMITNGLSQMNKTDSQLSSELILSRDALQNYLISKGKLSEKVPTDADEWSRVSKMDFNSKEEDNGVNEELIAQFEDFFQDEKASLGGVHNDEDISSDESVKSKKDFLEELERDLGDDFKDFVKFCVEEESKKEKRKATKRKTSHLKSYNDDSDYLSSTSLEYEDSEVEADPLFNKFLQENNNEEGFIDFLKELQTKKSFGPGSILLEQRVKNAKEG
ncbi:uncharacterized protein PRCAT00004543001 [Priceomyces carsonii]|uniref:uncharacterized protein n=1 Tax=Priceomyces carsonii TaxID=28549 RepID=UPI002ED89AAC|nr:unnamed protein product [Priceomyces carsonii]